jgi:hypothetical protein
MSDGRKEATAFLESALADDGAAGEDRHANTAASQRNGFA